MLGVERQLAKNQLGKVKKIQKEGLGNQVRQLHREDGCQVIRLGSAIAKTAVSQGFHSPISIYFCCLIKKLRSTQIVSTEQGFQHCI